MKEFIIITCLLLLGAMTIAAQNVIRRGNTFVQVPKPSAKVKDTLVTEFTYEIKSQTYPIILNKKSGKCYVWRTSKTGKKYRQYLQGKIREEILRKLRKQLIPTTSTPLKLDSE